MSEILTRRTSLLAAAGILLVTWFTACGSSYRNSVVSPAQPPQPTNSGLAFGPSVVLQPSRRFGGEPTLDMAKDGTFWVTDLQAEGILKSSDKGASWSFINPPLSTIGGGDMDAVSDDSGRLHVVDLEDQGHGPNCFFYYRSSDGGSSFDIVQSTTGGGVWLQGDGGCGATKGNNVDRPWVAAFGNTLYIADREQNRDPATGTLGTGVNISVDAGQTFTFTRVNNFNNVSGIAIDRLDGTVYLIGLHTTGFSNTLGRSVADAISVAISMDGKTFTTGNVFAAPAGVDVAQSPMARISVDGAHNVYAVWSDNSAGTVDTYLSLSRDHGKTWSKPLKIDSGLTVAAFPAITAGDSGRIAVAYYGTADPAKSTADAHGANWDVYVALSINATDAVPSFEIVKATATPFHQGSFCAHVSVCEGIDLTSQPLPLGYQGGILDFFSIAGDASGTVSVIWTDTTGAQQQDHIARQSGGNTLKAGS